MTEQANQEASTGGQSPVQLGTVYGVKAGMTRIFDNNGNHVPVTVVKLIPNYITQVKTADKDGYTAYQVGYGEKREKLISRPQKGHLSKGSVSANLSKFAEVRLDEVDSANVGNEVSIEEFSADTFIDVTGISKGKGFQGVIKRHNFAGGPAAHGSKFHRTGGSIGNRATPGKVWKNKKMPGHMGSQKKTIQNLKIVEVNAEKGYLLIKGSVPGSKNSFIKLATALKK